MAAHRSPSRRRLGASFAVTMAAGAVVVPAGAADADTVVDHFRTVSVSGTSTTRDGCLATTTDVAVRQEQYRSAGVSYDLSYSRSILDECTGEPVSYVIAFRATPEVFDVGPGRRSVHVVAEIPLEDPFTDQLTGEVVTMDNTWTAQGRSERSTEHLRDVVGGETVMIANSRRLRVDAAVSGTVALRDGEIDRISGGSVVVTSP